MTLCHGTVPDKYTAAPQNKHTATCKQLKFCSIYIILYVTLVTTVATRALKVATLALTVAPTTATLHLYRMTKVHQLHNSVCRESTLYTCLSLLHRTHRYSLNVPYTTEARFMANAS